MGKHLYEWSLFIDALNLHWRAYHVIMNPDHEIRNQIDSGRGVCLWSVRPSVRLSVRPSVRLSVV